MKHPTPWTVVVAPVVTGWESVYGMRQIQIQDANRDLVALVKDEDTALMIVRAVHQVEGV